MTAALMLVVGVIVTGVAMPAVLSLLTNTSLSPISLLWMWWSAIAGTVLSTVAALIMPLLPGHDDFPLVSWLLASCWAVLRSGPLHLDGAAALLVAICLALAVARSVLRIGRNITSVRRRSRTLLVMFGPVGRWEDGVLWIDHPDALAFSLGGRSQAVVASTGLRRHLGAAGSPGSRTFALGRASPPPGPDRRRPRPGPSGAAPFSTGATGHPPTRPGPAAIRRRAARGPAEPTQGRADRSGPRAGHRLRRP